MREVLFRGKRIDNGEWIEGCFLDKNNIGIFYDDTEESDCTVHIFPIISETIGQYTGLTDKNGTKIFEGDIVHCAFRFGSADMVVIFECGQFCLILAEKYHEYQTNMGGYDINCFTKEVVGNIYDNAELLKDGE